MSANTPNQNEHRELESDASSGWRAEYAYQAVDASIEPDVDGSRRDRLEAADRDDRTERYCQKHLDGRSS